MIKSVLRANRGEIAIRIARTARRMGIKTYVVRTAKEPEAVYLSAADAVINFPETDGNIPEFLDIDRLVGLAREYKIDSLHPGYGYLSENADGIMESSLSALHPKSSDLWAIKLQQKELPHRAESPCLEPAKEPYIPSMKPGKLPND